MSDDYLEQTRRQLYLRNYNQKTIRVYLLRLNNYFQYNKGDVGVANKDKMEAI
jgi:hypothetical protein